MIRIRNISKSFPGFSLRIDELDIKQGSYVVLLGDSGSGKSLLLEILTGLVQPDSGTLIVDNRDISALPVHKRPFGLVFQDLTLFPHMTVWKNIAYPLVIRKRRKATVDNAVREMAGKLGVSHLLNRKPAKLSGGEKQRVSLARTLITQPDCLLLDEPLSALDVNLRKEIRALLRSINRSGQTILHVTHDYDEAIGLASHIGVMNDGKLIQYGETDYILNQPRSPFVAKFAGIHNYFRVHMEKSPTGEQVCVTAGGAVIHISPAPESDQGYIVVPAKSVLLSTVPFISSAANQLSGKIREMVQARFGVEVSIDSDPPLVAQVTPQAVEKLNLVEGQKVWASFKASSVQFIQI